MCGIDLRFLACIALSGYVRVLQLLHKGYPEVKNSLNCRRTKQYSTGQSNGEQLMPSCILLLRWQRWIRIAVSSKANDIVLVCRGPACMGVPHLLCRWRLLLFVVQMLRSSFAGIR